MQYSSRKKFPFKKKTMIAVFAAFIGSYHTSLIAANNVPPGFFKAPDGKIYANNPNTAVAPPGYYLRKNGTLIKLDVELGNSDAPAAPNIPLSADEVPPGFHKMPNGQIMANDPSNAIAPPGYHMMPNGVLMSNSGGGNGGGGHAHHHGGGHHGAGMWMFDIRYTHMYMKDLLDTTNKLTAEQAVAADGDYKYMMAPVDMTMQMVMGMVMYGVTDKFMIMGMGHYMKNTMTMLTSDLGKSNMKSSGIADTVVSGMLQMPYKLTLNIGLSIPTGDTNVRGPMQHQATADPVDQKYPYGMQLGTGSWDIKHGISYADAKGKIGWGGSYEYTSRMNKNSNDYKWGNLLLADTWIRYDFTPSFNSTAKLKFRALGQIEGSDPTLDTQNDTSQFPDLNMMSPAMDATAYGGKRFELELGAKYTIQAYSLTGEIAVPVYQNLWGPQMKTQWIASVNFGAMF